MKLKLTIFLILIVTFAYAQLLNGDLAANQARIFARINCYDPDLYNLLLERKRIEINGENQIFDFQGSKWQITRQVSPLEKPGKYKIDVSFKCLSGKVDNASVSVDLDFSGWSKENYVLIPGAVYNGNRYEVVRMDYSPFFISKEQMGLDKPILLSDQPRLNFREGCSQIQERSGSMSLPSIGFQSVDSKKGFWLFFRQANNYGDYGIDIWENKGRSKATLTLTSPVVRELYKYQDIRMDLAPSDDSPAHFKAGDECTISFIVDFFQSPNIQMLYNELNDIRTKHYLIPSQPDVIPFSAIFPIIEKHKNLENWRDDSYYATSTGEGWGDYWQPAWVGGLTTLYPLITEGDAFTRGRIVQNLDWLYSRGMSPSNLYFDLAYKGRFTNAKEAKPFGANLALTRKNASAVFWALKLFDFMEKNTIPVKEEWKAGNLKALQTLLHIWDKYGQLGQYVNQQTGELVVGGTTSGGIFPAALCEAWRQTKDAKYLDAAKAMADYYYKNFVTKGLTCGGPSDAMQSFDHESSYSLLESFTTLYETTGEAKWLKYSEEMAAQFASWVVAYDYKFPANSAMGKLNMRTTGAVNANTQNKHAAPGICTHSGIALLKLYRATQNPFYIKLLAAIAHTIPQYMSFKGHEIPGYHEGWISERINMTDWQSSIPIGGVLVQSNWDETSMLLTISELPGIYVNKDTREVFVLDHVDAKITMQSKESFTIEITNTTTFDAEVKLLAETSMQMALPLGQNAFLNWQKVKVPAGKTLSVKLKNKS